MIAADRGPPLVGSAERGSRPFVPSQLLRLDCRAACSPPSQFRITTPGRKGRVPRIGSHPATLPHSRNRSGVLAISGRRRMFAGRFEAWHAQPRSAPREPAARRSAQRQAGENGPVSCQVLANLRAHLNRHRGRRGFRSRSRRRPRPYPGTARMHDAERGRKTESAVPIHVSSGIIRCR